MTDVGDEIGEKLIKETLNALKWLTDRAYRSIPDVNANLQRKSSSIKDRIIEKKELNEEALAALEAGEVLDLDSCEPEELAQLEVGSVSWDREGNTFANALTDAGIAFNRTALDESVLYTVRRTVVDKVLDVVGDVQRNINGFRAERFINLKEFSDAALTPEGLIPGDFSQLDLTEEQLEVLRGKKLEMSLGSREEADLMCMCLAEIGCPCEVTYAEDEIYLLANASDLIEARDRVPEIEEKLQNLYSQGYFRGELPDIARSKAFKVDPKVIEVGKLQESKYVRKITPKKDIAQGKEIAALQAKEEQRKLSRSRGGR